jgi:hypothetical protein
VVVVVVRLVRVHALHDHAPASAGRNSPCCNLRCCVLLRVLQAASARATAQGLHRCLLQLKHQQPSGLLPPARQLAAQLPWWMRW